MVLSEYIGKLQEILDEHGDIGMVYSSDDEGNSYELVWYSPSVVLFNEKDNEVVFLDSEDVQDYKNDDRYVLSVCVN